ncbi:trifunctional nucleotide phosphoesterase protein YfkN-like [Protopterus annectens]|uniref:trifunctional nucleotide phosphoesterase protein YfkN-like n=1 Tax=Protopterus annectens TaxID=7888 RepID=UPI001CFA128A|nr:trifunctional nucleotide phosphoesterase protein YfkN-like [Protopterus annectens]
MEYTILEAKVACKTMGPEILSLVPPIRAPERRFAAALKSFKSLNPLILFSGDCLSPSLLSTTTKGKHMIPILNALGVHSAVFGNHEFDFGLDVLEDFKRETQCTWFLSNVYDKISSEPLGHGVVSRVIEWNNLNIGLMGLVEEDWLDTLNTVDKSDLLYFDYVEVASKLSKELRNKGAEIIIALTHMKWSNDIRLARAACGLNLVLGGHDHSYGVIDENGILIVKSGSDFRSLTKIDISRSNNSFQYATQKIDVLSDLDEDINVKAIVGEYIANQQPMLKEVLFQTDIELDGRYTTVRKSESNLGNLITNAMLETTHAEIALLNSGTLRSDRVHPAGNFTVYDLLTILPLVDLVVVLKITGNQLLKALENGVSRYPELDGRFPQVAGIEFGFDPDAQPGHRVAVNSVQVQGQDLIKCKLYHLAVKEYIAKGKDGYTVFQSCPWLYDIEAAQVLSTIVRNHFESTTIVWGLTCSRSVRRMRLIKKSQSASVKDLELLKLLIFTFTQSVSVGVTVSKLGSVDVAQITKSVNLHCDKSVDCISQKINTTVCSHRQCCRLTAWSASAEAGRQTTVLAFLVQLLDGRIGGRCS